MTIEGQLLIDNRYLHYEGTKSLDSIIVVQAWAGTAGFDIKR